MSDRILLALPCFGEFLAVLQLHNAILGEGRLPRRLAVPTAIVFWIVLQCIVKDYVAYSVWAISFNALRFFAASLLFGGSLTRKLLSLVLCGVIILGYGNVLGTIQAVLVGGSLSSTFRLPVNILLYGVCLNLIIFLCVRILRRWLRITEPAQKAAGCIYLCVVAALNVMLSTLGQASDRYPFMFLICIGLILSVAVYVALLAMLSTKTIQARLAQERADALTESYQIQRRLTHEFENHMGAISFYLSQKDIPGAQAYLDSVSQRVAAVTPVINTHNPLIDALLSKEHRSAAEKDVLLSFDLCDLSAFPLHNADLVTVLCYLLDNAISAAAAADPPQVTLRIRRLGGEYVVSVRNRVSQDIPLRQDELPASTKSEPGHGMGLANVRAVVERCGGEYAITCKDKWFCFTCSIPCEG